MGHAIQIAIYLLSSKVRGQGNGRLGHCRNNAKAEDAHDDSFHSQHLYFLLFR